MEVIDLELQGLAIVSTQWTAFNVALVYWSRPAKGRYTSQSCSCYFLNKMVFIRCIPLTQWEPVNNKSANGYLIYMHKQMHRIGERPLSKQMMALLIDADLHNSGDKGLTVLSGQNKCREISFERGDLCETVKLVMFTFIELQNRHTHNCTVINDVTIRMASLIVRHLWFGHNRLTSGLSWNVRTKNSCCRTIKAAIFLLVPLSTSCTWC